MKQSPRKTSRVKPRETASAQWDIICRFYWNGVYHVMQNNILRSDISALSIAQQNNKNFTFETLVSIYTCIYLCQKHCRKQAGYSAERSFQFQYLGTIIAHDKRPWGTWRYLEVWAFDFVRMCITCMRVV